MIKVKKNMNFRKSRFRQSTCTPKLRLCPKLFLQTKSLSLCVHPVHNPTLSIWCSVIITISHFRQEIGCCLSVKRLSVSRIVCSLKDLTGVFDCSSKQHYQHIRLHIGPGGLFMSCFCVNNCLLVYWSRRLACATRGGGRKRSWPFF